ncbi:MAG: Regulator of RpoS [Chroococcopsis gigantea SAG 12.99]|jgi:twitching motility two-component system response regulator PilG|nr:DUF4388 domain-containing protein [Chlorogloea purpurea SAG 13.99]MDV3001347.1 Regulator of RpoS [Chroococcopsis gigantea SAG 12.99]
MQGTLNEIDIRSILQLIELGQRTGELFIEPYDNNSSSKRMEIVPRGWFVFFVNGQIVYATDRSSHNLLRLKDYVRFHRIQQGPREEVSTANILNTPEYFYIWQLLEKNLITPAQAREIIGCMVRETLFDLFCLRQGAFTFELGSPLAPQLMTMAVAPLVRKIVGQVQQWKHFHPQIQHPDQFFVIVDPEELQGNIPDRAYRNLDKWAKNKTSLRQLSRYLGRDLVLVARTLYPYVQRGWVQFVHPGAQKEEADRHHWPQPDNMPLKIACIDDDLSVGKTVEAILADNGYGVTLYTDPLEALRGVFIEPPDVILCDLTMPKLDGYDLCAMLRHSGQFRQTPIIMLTSKEAFIDRVKARIIGATDYLTKPFGGNELLLLLEKFNKS